jgi:myosin V
MKGSSRSNTNTAAQQALIAHWQGIVKSLGNFLNIMKVNNVSIMFIISHFTRTSVLKSYKIIIHFNRFHDH